MESGKIHFLWREEVIPSMKLHESCGFRVVGYREKVARDKNGEWQNTFLMERRSKVIF